MDTYDLAIIGAGPGGYVAAIRAAQLGMRVVCVDQRATLGGTCLNVGCIPSKALLHTSHEYIKARDDFAKKGIMLKSISVDLPTMMAYKEATVTQLTQGIQFLFKKNNITFIQATATFQDAQTVALSTGQTLQAKRILIASGSSVQSLPGIEIDHDRILDSTDALSLGTIPDSLIVIGGGYIGLEMSSVWSRLGTKVTVLEAMDHLLPAMDSDVAAALHRALEKQGIAFQLHTLVDQVKPGKKSVTITCHDAKDPKQKITLDAQYVLVCAGRKPNTQNLGLDRIGLSPDARGFLAVDKDFQTAVPGVYAIGDIIPGPMLAHKAEEEGIACVERMMGQKTHVNHAVIPAIIYTDPEVACVGQTEDQLKAQGIPYRAGKFPFTANARARSQGTTEGFVKILAHAATDEVLGVHIIHAEAGNLIAEAALGMEYRASSEDIARTCHAHPTLGEAVKEAAWATFAKAIHV
jgi:dihydrolipoamide dehydrogenase